MGVCFCTLGGTLACLNCPNRDITLMPPTMEEIWWLQLMYDKKRPTHIRTWTTTSQ